LKFAKRADGSVRRRAPAHRPRRANLMVESRDKFWDRLENVNAGMLGVFGEARHVPMSHYADQPLNRLWFITARGTDLVKAVEAGAKDAHYVIASAGDGLYSNMTGTLSLSNDTAKLDEMWNAVASAWFEDGKRDADLRLLEFALSDVEVWTTKGGVGFLFQVAKANITGDKPDIGEHFALKF
jgi:general stress protein 26